MMEKISVNYCTLAIFLYIPAVYTVVPEYCTQPFNRGDCGMKPTPVFKYWKPGSRCEIDYWRGCPTANKFSDVYNCTLTCIFKIRNVIEDTQNECEIPLNKDTCTEEQKYKSVFTYENGACVKRIWKGCPSVNRFDTKVECIEACADNNLNIQNECETPLNMDTCTDVENHKIVFSYENGACVESIWKGCPSMNRFDTKAECVTACVDDNWNTEYECTTPLNRDTCTEVQKHKIVFSSENTGCVERIWKGCPSINRFSTKAECITACADNNWNMPDECKTPLDTNTCSEEENNKIVFTYDNGACVKRTWKGCPSQNRFDTKAECISVCTDDNWNTPNECTTPLDRNSCTEEREVVFSYENGACVESIWHGCPSLNRFDTKDECVTACVDIHWNTHNECKTPLNRDTCAESHKHKIVFSYEDGDCVESIWKGCPSLNRFDTKAKCIAACVDDNLKTKNECETPLNSIPCTDERKHKIVFTYENGTCEERIWKGCPSLNRFDTEADCTIACADNNYNANLHDLKVEQLKEIDNILNDLTEDPVTETVESSILNNEKISSSNENSDTTITSDYDSSETTTFAINQIGVVTE